MTRTGRRFAWAALAAREGEFFLLGIALLSVQNENVDEHGGVSGLLQIYRWVHLPGTEVYGMYEKRP